MNRSTISRPGSTERKSLAPLALRSPTRSRARSPKSEIRPVPISPDPLLVGLRLSASDSVLRSDFGFRTSDFGLLDPWSVVRGPFLSSPTDTFEACSVLLVRHLRMLGRSVRIANGLFGWRRRAQSVRCLSNRCSITRGLPFASFTASNTAVRVTQDGSWAR
jgi:hypothetical protein